MTNDLVKRLRDRTRDAYQNLPCDEAADLIEQQAARIAELESAQSSQQGAETFVLRALVAAGHVSQAKVDEAFSIAANTPGVTHPHATESDRIRREALEEAAKACDEEARFSEKNGFYPQAHKARRCAAAIRALSQTPAPGGE